MRKVLVRMSFFFNEHILVHVVFSGSFLLHEYFLSAFGSNNSTHVRFQCTLTLFPCDYVHHFPITTELRIFNLLHQMQNGITIIMEISTPLT